MKRGLLGAALLAALILVSGFFCRSVDRSLIPMEAALYRAALAAEAGDWHTAQAQADGAAQHWEHCRSFAAAFSDHAPLEQIDCLFSRLEIWHWAKNADFYADLCIQLIRELEALIQSDKLSWENFL